MKKLIVLLLIGFILSCSKYSKKKHVTTLKISENLYNEVFKVYSGGVFASDSYSNYITDSIFFRKYVGTRYYDDEEIYCDILNGDIVRVSKVSRMSTGDTIEVKYYYVAELKKEGRFE